MRLARRTTSRLLVSSLHAKKWHRQRWQSLQTNISTLAAFNSMAGVVWIDNSGVAGLTIGVVNGLVDVVNSAVAGQVVLTTATSFDLPSGRRVAAAAGIDISSTNTLSGSTFQIMAISTRLGRR